MTEPTAAPDQNGAAPWDALRRYVPLAVWAAVILVILAIPLKISSYGYLPQDDALRHAAKAVSGKSWQDILVLAPGFRDQNFVWHDLLTQVHRWTQCGADGLVIFEVAGLFALLGWAPLPWLRRPEAWLITLITVAVTTGMTERFMYGRPFLLTMAGLVAILSAWQFRDAASPPTWRTTAWMTGVIGVCTLVHGVWYLWALPVAAFFLARQFAWGFRVAAAWVGGVFLGACVTGHPVDAIAYAVEIGRRTVEVNALTHTLVTELQPFSGDVLTLLVFAALLVLRRLARLNSRPLLSNPAFWLACLCWVLGFKALRFWNDWGRPAFMVLLTYDLQLLLQSRLAADSFRRLALACLLAAVTFLSVTSDYQRRWTHNLTWSYLTQDNPDLKGWLPDQGGIFYTADMTLFFETFFKNPKADWKYILGYEPALMPDEDFKVYQNIRSGLGGDQAYEPWVKKMRPADRLVVRGYPGSPPDVPQLEWKYGVNGIWIGRLPRVAPDDTPPPTVPAAKPAAGASTNAPASLR